MSRFVARLVVGVLVSAQMALAGYACPVMPATSAGDAVQPVAFGERARLDALTDAMRADCWSLDKAQPNLCAAHYQFGEQNADGKPAPTVAPALLASFYPAESLLPLADPLPAMTGVDDPPPAGSPPLAILHCCFRI